MRIFKILALTGMLAMVGTACTDLEVTNLNDPDRQRAIQTPGDVESLISGSYSTWHYVQHSYRTEPALSVMANAHSSSWGNFGMRDNSEEPRIAFKNDPSYSYVYVVERPWDRSYRSLAGIRDGLAAIGEGIVIEEAGVDVTSRAVAFGKLVQALSFTNLALLFDKAFVVDENSDLEALEFMSAEEVWAAALVKYAEAIQVAQTSDFTIPAPWVGDYREWTRDDFIGFAKAFRARFQTQMPRNEADRAALDWNGILTDLADGLPFEYNTNYDGTNWGIHYNKRHSGFIEGWARADYRTLGPADVSGAWETWINAAPANKDPFEITTPDSRITEPMQPRTNGKYVKWIGNSPFPLDRGIWHFCDYIFTNHKQSTLPGSRGDYPDFVDKEVDFIRAEAWYRLGQIDAARDVVNTYRANGDLPPFVTEANPDTPDMCVPQMPDGSCGDLWEALKYEKRIEVYHYGFATEYFDDRGWGDLVVATPLELPVPAKELLLLLEEIYTFGGNAGNGAPGGGVTPSLIFDFSPEALALKRQSLDALRQLDIVEAGDVIGRRR